MNASVAIQVLPGVQGEGEVIRIVDGEIRNVLSEKEIKKIKHFLEDKFIKKETINQTIIKDNIYLNYLSDIKVKSFLDFHKKQQHNIIDNILDADIVITLITKKALLNNEFITNINLLTSRTKNVVNNSIKAIYTMD